MSTITTKDGAALFYKDWGPRGAQPVVFHPGYPHGMCQTHADSINAGLLAFIQGALSVHSRPIDAAAS